MIATEPKLKVPPQPKAHVPRQLPPGTVRLDLAAVLSAVSCSRMFVRHTLMHWNLPTLVDDAELIVSELVTNAVKATGICTPEPTWGELDGLNLVSVFVKACGAGVCIQVWDADDEPLDLSPAGADDEDESGRGLFLVRMYARQMGRFYPRGGGKIVWAELPLERPEPALPRRVAKNRATIHLHQPDPELLRAVLDGLKRL